MSPTVFRHGEYRFFFFSLEEQRVHIHVSSPRGEAKFWLEPAIKMAHNYGLEAREIRQLEKIIHEHKDKIILSWKEHFRN
jgi:Domain of unknown function (DUF4160)